MASLEQKREYVLWLMEGEAAGALQPTDQQTLDVLRERGIAPPRQEALKPAGSMDAAMISAGDTVLDAGRTLATAGNRGMAALGDLVGGSDAGEFAANADALQAEQAESDQLMAGVREANPVASAVGGALPYFAVPMGAGARLAGAALPGQLGARVGGSLAADAALVGAGAGALNPDTDALTGALFGLGGKYVGDAIGAGANKLLTSAPVKEGFETVAQYADDLGIRMTPGQRSGGRTAELMEATADSIPIISEAGRKIQGANQTRANQVAAKAIGETSDVVNFQTLEAASRNIGDEFEALTKGANIRLDDTFKGRLAKHIADMDSPIESLRGAGNKLLEEVSEFADNTGMITGPAYQRLRKKLQDYAVAQYRNQAGDRTSAEAATKTVEALDDAMERSLGTGARRRFRDARTKWRSLLQLESPGVVNPSTGDVSSTVLGNVLKRQDKPGYMRGRNVSDLYKLGHVGQGMKASFGTSGTGERLLSAGLVHQMLDKPVQTVSFLGPGYAAASAWSNRILPRAGDAVARGVNRGMEAVNDSRLAQAMGTSGAQGAAGRTSNLGARVGAGAAEGSLWDWLGQQTGLWD